jgi:hypothetical protein
MAVTTLLKILPIAGPRRAKITITTTATKTRIRAYSTKPWPFSLGANNIVFHLLSSHKMFCFAFLITLYKCLRCFALYRGLTTLAPTARHESGPAKGVNGFVRIAASRTTVSILHIQVARFMPKRCNVFITSRPDTLLTKSYPKNGFSFILKSTPPD